MAAVTGINAPETFFSREYAANMGLLLQQEQSKLRQTVTVQSVRGYDVSLIDQIGERNPQAVTTRHADTVTKDSPTDRRWVKPTKYTDAELFDTFDLIRQNVDPRSQAMQAFKAGFNRKMDDVIIEGFTSSNRTGQEGGTSTSFTAGNIVANGGTNLTVDKLQDVHQLALEADYDPDTEPLQCIISPAGLRNLLDSTEVTSSDFNSVKALVRGEIDTFMGMRFTIHNRLPGSTNYQGSLSLSANIHRALVYPASAVTLATWEEPMAKVSERNDKNHSFQIYWEMGIGACRLDEAKCFAIDYDTSA